MAKCGRYIYAQLKRVIKVFPTILLTTLFLLGCMALLMWVVLEKNNASEEKQMIQIGLAGDLEGSYLGIGIQTIQNLDSSRFAISFIDMTEEEAKENLLQGKISAYVVIPEGFVDSLVTGENKPITYVTSVGASGVGSTIMNELVETISKLVVESQNAIYGAQWYMADHGMQDVYWDATDELYLQIANFILGRTQVYELETVGVAHQLSFVGYYACGVLVLFLLLWGIVCSPLFVKRSHTLPKLLKSRGRNVLGQVLGEYLAYVVLMLGTLALIFALLAVVMGMTGMTLPEWEGQGVGALFLFFIELIPVCMLLSALQFLVYETVSGMVGSVLAQFLIAIGLGYISGCLYPISFFPESIQKLAAYLPTGAAVEYAGACLKQTGWGGAFMVMTVYFALFFGLAVMVRTYKIRNS